MVVGMHGKTRRCWTGDFKPNSLGQFGLRSACKYTQVVDIEAGRVGLSLGRWVGRFLGLRGQEACLKILCLTLRMRPLVYYHRDKFWFLIYFFQISKPISKIRMLILCMFVLIWMHFLPVIPNFVTKKKKKLWPKKVDKCLHNPIPTPMQKVNMLFSSYFFLHRNGTWWWNVCTVT